MDVIFQLIILKNKIRVDLRAQSIAKPHAASSSCIYLIPQENWGLSKQTWRGKEAPPLRPEAFSTSSRPHLPVSRAWTHPTPAHKTAYVNARDVCALPSDAAECWPPCQAESPTCPCGRVSSRGWRQSPSPPALGRPRRRWPRGCCPGTPQTASSPCPRLQGEGLSATPLHSRTRQPSVRWMGLLWETLEVSAFPLKTTG